MKGAVSERAPQKYLIQNHSGVRLFYWAERVRRRRSNGLASGLIAIIACCLHAARRLLRRPEPAAK